MNLTDEQVEAWKRAFELAGVDLNAMGECLVEIAKAVIITWEQVANIARAGLMVAENELEELEALRKEAAFFNPPTARDRKEAREKRRAAERATASRFRQYKARENARGAGKRTGARGREWRGADRS